MPRSVNLPVYDPMAKYKLLKFDNKNTLEIASLHHGAGKLGLRKRDVVTHLEGEAILDYDAFVSMLQAYYEQDPETSLALVVNADKETAQALQRRSQTIICASTRRL
jgi:S1-C subfamily serine protease